MSTDFTVSFKGITSLLEDGSITATLLIDEYECECTITRDALQDASPHLRTLPSSQLLEHNLDRFIQIAMSKFSGAVQDGILITADDLIDSDGTH